MEAAQRWSGAATVREYQRERARVMNTAELMPAAHYGFRIDANSKPFAANLVAVADLAGRECGGWMGRPVSFGPGDPQARITTKADVTDALTRGFAACDAYFGAATGAAPAPSDALDSLLVHITSMANFLAGHLRAKGIEPPK